MNHDTCNNRVLVSSRVSLPEYCTGRYVLYSLPSYLLITEKVYIIPSKVPLGTKLSYLTTKLVHHDNFNPISSTGSPL